MEWREEQKSPDEKWGFVEFPGQKDQDRSKGPEDR